MWGKGKYILLGAQQPRSGPGLQYARNLLSFSDSRTDRFGRLREGTETEVLEIRILSVSVWGRTKDGWLCLKSGEVLYAEAETKI